MGTARRAARSIRAACAVGSFLLLAVGGSGLFAAGEPSGTGVALYRESCASCHGVSGQGVEGEYSRPLEGDLSVAELARFIDEEMPKDEPEGCTGDAARAVARYIHETFYSPIAQARNRKPRIEPARLTVRQYRNAVADLVGSFREPAGPQEKRGLRGEYFDSRRPGKDRVVERIDPRVRFDFSTSNPAPDEFENQGFTARWRGSVEAPSTGVYEFAVHTDHAARLWVNDSDEPLIDAWVKSGDETEYRASTFLLGGRRYPLRLEFTSRNQGVKKDEEREKPLEAFIELHWRPPHQVAEPVPPHRLSPERGPEVFVVRTPFPPDDRSTGYERGTSVSEAWDDATTTAAIETAEYISGHLRELSGVEEDDDDRKAGLSAFCRRLVERAFRRPLTAGQEELYIERQFANAPDLETAVQRVVLLALKSPRFLYLRMGKAAPDDYDVASRLAFALWDSLPDEELLETAARGELRSVEEVRRQAERMSGDRRARWKLRGFLHHWLEVEQTEELAKDSERYPGFDAALASDLRTSLEMFLEEDVLGGERADFRRLLLSEELYLNGRLARFYDFDLPEDAPFQKVPTRASQRVGVLSHPYLMARFAYTDSSSPIHRGVFVIRSVLGRPLLPPPDSFTPFSPDLHPDLTTRERVALQTKPDTCQSCHGKINPLGFTLEHFDAVGRFREKEKGRPVDASGSYQRPSGGTERLAGARDLAEFVARSPSAHRAFAGALFHHLIKEPILAYGPEMPSELERVFASSDFDVRRLAVRIAVTAALHGGEEGDASSPESGQGDPGDEDPPGPVRVF